MQGNPLKHIISKHFGLCTASVSTTTKAILGSRSQPRIRRSLQRRTRIRPLVRKLRVAVQVWVCWGICPAKKRKIELGTSEISRIRIHIGAKAHVWPHPEWSRIWSIMSHQISSITQMIYIYIMMSDIINKPYTFPQKHVQSWEASRRNWFMNFHLSS